MLDTFKYISDSLKGIYPESEVKSLSYLLIEEITGFSRTEILTNKSTIFSEEQRNLLTCFVQKLKKNIPLQYIFGETEFYGLKFKVDESVLIPRPETEELVEWIIADNKKETQNKILDIGTGSGIIAISLKKHLPYADVTAWDISEKALQTACENSQLNDVKVDFEKVDILKENTVHQKWDVVVSNPPYIPEREKDNMEANVLEHEPHIALFVPDNDPLLFYRKIAEFALKNLTSGGMLYFEIHYDAGQKMIDLLTSLGFKDIILKKDIAGNDRMMKAVLREHK